jgi:hypothetical protein
MDAKKILENLYSENEDSPKYYLLIEKLNEKYKGDKTHLKKSIIECKSKSNSFADFKNCVTRKLKLGFRPLGHDKT